jgi:hypothetical protein
MASRVVIFGMFSIIALVISIALIMQKSDNFDKQVQGNGDCLKMCEGIGFGNFLDMTHEDCMANDPTASFMKQVTEGVTAGCCCVEQ